MNSYFLFKTVSQESDEENEDSDANKKANNSAQKKNNNKAALKYIEEEENEEGFNKFEAQHRTYIQPTIQRGYSESSDLFADSPQANTKGIKRTREDEDFNSGSYKRFKN